MNRQILFEDLSDNDKAAIEDARRKLEEHKNQLKPCPFCGSTDLRVTQDYYGADDYDKVVSCNDCSSQGEPCATEAQARHSWNKRISARRDA